MSFPQGAIDPVRDLLYYYTGKKCSDFMLERIAGAVDNFISNGVDSIQHASIIKMYGEIYTIRDKSGS